MIETPNLFTALNRDEVEAELLKGKVRGRRIGKVSRIIKRAKTRFVGTIEERTVPIPPFLKEAPSPRDRGFNKGKIPHPSGPLPLGKGESRFALVVVPDDFRMYAPIVIPRPPKEAGKGLKALAEIKEWKAGNEPQGAILKVIGKKGEHEVEMESIVLERGFESSFPREVEKEARVIAEEARRLLRETGSPVPEGEMKKRRDFRSTTLFTIDPANAKDFDDALSFRYIPNSKFNIPLYEIGIHIADVSHYVREGAALDREARERGTSVYLVDRTVPMLPHELSNDLCSLNPDVDRLAFSAVFEMDGNGRVYEGWFGKTVIHSQKRFTYETAQESIDDFTRSGLFPDTRPDLVKSSDLDFGEALCALNSIAKKLRQEKIRQGAIDFEQDEVGFELDARGHPVRIFKKKRLDTHKLVEEFMLLANREVASLFSKEASRSGGKLRFIYRTHDSPDREKLDQLRVFVRAMGHELPVRKGGGVHGRDLQALFNAIEGHAAESLIKTAAIRSMAKAMYSTMNIGHFGLSFEYYTHFTSPIRRYPDLLVHRSLERLLERHRVDPQKLERLERLAHDATQREIAAAEAERESIKLKQVEYMEERIGKEFDGIISGVTEWGIYVEEKETRSEGMVKLRDLKDDYYILDERNYAVVGEKTKKRYALGNRVRFKVAGADVERKTLDYRLVQ
jgi:ribonuclease R